LFSLVAQGINEALDDVKDHRQEIIARLNTAMPPPEVNAAAAEIEIDDPTPQPPDPALQGPSSPMLVNGSFPEEVRAQILGALPWLSHILLSSCSQAVNVALQLPAIEEDLVWTKFWRKQPSWQALDRPERGLKHAFLLHMRQRCVECGTPTVYVFALANTRLCELCERSHCKYNLVSTAMVRDPYRLINTCLIRGLCHMNTWPTR